MRRLLDKGVGVTGKENERVGESLEKYSPPPKTFWKTVAALGPGIILASSIVGSGELIGVGSGWSCGRIQYLATL